MKNNNFLKLAATYGAILGAISIVINLIFYLLRDYPLGLLSTFLLFAATLWVIVTATKKYRESLGGYISYGSAFGFGLTIFIFTGIIIGAYQYIFNNFIDPELAQQQLDWSMSFFQDSNIFSQEEMNKQYDMVVEMTRNPIMFLFSSIFSHAIMGTIFCLISSIFLKKEKPANEF